MTRPFSWIYVPVPRGKCSLLFPHRQEEPLCRSRVSGTYVCPRATGTGCETRARKGCWGEKCRALENITVESKCLSPISLGSVPANFMCFYLKMLCVLRRLSDYLPRCQATPRVAVHCPPCCAPAPCPPVKATGPPDRAPGGDPLIDLTA